MNASTDSGQLQALQRRTAGTTSTGAPVSTWDRRHDLDALRAIAMLLGIVLHAALSFTAIPWSVHDSQQGEIYHILFACIHGFRMPLFFMLSGFFTAMLWRKRGLLELVKHRFKRIFLPLTLGCITIVPAMWAVSYLVSRPSTSRLESSPVFTAVVSGDVERVRNELQNPDVDADYVDPNSGSPLLCTAVFLERTEIVKLLVDAGADVNLENRDQATPLHIAAFMGRSKEASLLLEAGADAEVLDGSGLTPGDLLQMDFQTTNFIASSLGVPLDKEALQAGRKAIAVQLGIKDYLGSSAGTRQSSGFEGLQALLFYMPVFMHLWFLWFLCWLIAAFLLYARIAQALKIERLPRWIVSPPISLLWLIPLTMLPQSFMEPASFGPDSSMGLVPVPSVLVYYAIFFFFGAIYWDVHGGEKHPGGVWYVSLPLALFIVFPIAFDLVSGSLGFIPRPAGASTNALLSNFLEATYAWLMAFGLIGLFQRFLNRENKALRYISDSSYWLYLSHLPLVILTQWFVRDLPIPAFVKFGGIVIVVSILLLITYEYGVRHTAIGRLLNGPRPRLGPPSLVKNPET